MFRMYETIYFPKWYEPNLEKTVDQIAMEITSCETVVPVRYMHEGKYVDHPTARQYVADPSLKLNPVIEIDSGQDDDGEAFYSINIDVFVIPGPDNFNQIAHQLRKLANRFSLDPVIRKSALED